MTDASARVTATDLSHDVDLAVQGLATEALNLSTSAALMFVSIEIFHNYAFLSSLQQFRRRGSLKLSAAPPGLSSSDLFVVSTSLLVVIAAINVGVAVLQPESASLSTMNRFQRRRRARQLVWYRSLAASVRLLGLTSLLCAVLSWTSGPLASVWPASTLLSALTVVEIIIVINVRTVVDEEAEHLLEILNMFQSRVRLQRSVEQLARRWSRHRPAGVALELPIKSREPIARPVVVYLFSLFWSDYVFIWIIVFCDGVRLGAFAAWENQVEVLLVSLALLFLGVYASYFFLVAMSGLFRSGVRRGNLFDKPWKRRDAEGLEGLLSSRLDRWVQLSWLLIVAALILVVAYISLSSFGLNWTSICVSLWLFVTWVVVPVGAMLSAVFRGRGPLSFLCRRFIVRVWKSIPGLESEISAKAQAFVADSAVGDDARAKASADSLGESDRLSVGDGQ